ncbi:MAG: hypothetical protein V2A53_04530 [bacterium]
MPGLDIEIEKETDKILLALIEKAARKARDEIEKTGTLSMDHAIPLLLKSQYNHILHLDTELVAIRNLMDERFTKMDERFTSMNERFNERFAKMDEKFTKMDERFNERFAKMDERFAKMDERFAKIHDRITDLYKWIVASFIGIVTIIGSLMATLKFFIK